MVKGVGIDSVEITRFKEMMLFPIDRLQKIFSDQEIAYCFENGQKTAERLAARFAVKEALFKALSHIMPDHGIPFLTMCKHVSVNKQNNGNPVLTIDWQKLTNANLPETPYKALVSITHTRQIATAIVTIVENS